MDQSNPRKTDVRNGSAFRWRTSVAALIFLVVTLLATFPARSQVPEESQTGNPKESDLDLVSPPPPSPSADSSESTDLPIARNREVERFIDQFRQARKNFSRVLERSGRYFTVMRTILAEQNLPEDLVYLAVIESGLYFDATSSSGAKGFWQFLGGTAKRYGLVINRWVDDRRDPIKSTHAAARYLTDLYDMFQSWLLAQAGYNAGENAIQRATERGATKDFWELARKGMLREETRNFVPKLMAAVLIGKNPQEYGFGEVKYMAPMEYEEIPVEGEIDLRVLAKLGRVSYDQLRDLNPSLLGPYTPPSYPGGYRLRVPPQNEENLLRALKLLMKKGKPASRFHRVAGGETPATIAARYGIAVTSLLKANRISDPRRVRVGTALQIPLE
ncbi:MAG: transglycosylase SLT domain-containing protein [Candidatus Tectomicrobia bacterium]|uniref:Transglycosylase SLT domain-containing protein n=1 Tax=Tectimicrobiota bacterium TaxID=2528274 RepID=A0A932GQL9_UNCTE|nr:transglycosylase SLT domain-containing protein [Candidatus Tectomicrobia bacterium]